MKLNIGDSVHDPTDPVGRLLFVNERERRVARLRAIVEYAARRGDAM